MHCLRAAQTAGQAAPSLSRLQRARVRHRALRTPREIVEGRGLCGGRGLREGQGRVRGGADRNLPAAVRAPHRLDRVSEDSTDRHEAAEGGPVTRRLPGAS